MNDSYKLLQNVWTVLYPVQDELKFTKDLFGNNPDLTAKLASIIYDIRLIREMIGEHIGERDS